MANEFGKDWRIRAKPAGGGASVAIGGETSFDWRRTSQEQDLSDKDSGIYGATSYGNQRINFAVSGNLKLPDPGLAAIVAASKLSPPQIEIEVVKADVVKFAGVVAIGNFSGTFPATGPATYSFDMANAAAPTVDDLTATGSGGGGA